MMPSNNSNNKDAVYVTDGTNQQQQQHPLATSSTVTVEASSSPSSSSKASVAFISTHSRRLSNKDEQTSSSKTATTAATTAVQPIPLPTRMVLAASSGMVAATVCHPLDVIRVQMQTSTGSYRNSLHAAITIYRTSGLQNGLYAGISAAYLRQWLYGSCRIGIYSYMLENARLQNISEGRPANDIALSSKLAMGCISGGIGSFVGTPSELALVRMSADSKLPVAERRNYKSVVDCVVRIVQEEGFTKLWCGATPTVARATCLSACQMGVTSEFKSRLCASGWFGPDGQYMGGYPMMFCATLMSSFVANCVANPFDVVKSRIQNQRTNVDGTMPYKNMMDCFVKSIRSEGPSVMLAGFTPAFIKLAPYSIISLTVAEKLTKAVTGKDAL